MILLDADLNTCIAELREAILFKNSGRIRGLMIEIRSLRHRIWKRDTRKERERRSGGAKDT